MDKAGLRAQFLSARRTLAPPVRRAADHALVAALMQALPDTGTVAAHLPFGGEPGASAVPPLPDALRDAGFQVLLPVLRDDLDLDWAAYDGHLMPARYGMSEPVGPRLGVAAIADTAAVVLPAVAVDRSGVRLGRGGGSYDRALARVPTGVPVIVLLYDSELVARLPHEPHDRHVTGVMTPARGLVRLPT
ncbi:MAG: 5-formyltetrahydrofolate cyclo-ligase [Micromonosporaceae bacterium]